MADKAYKYRIYPTKAQKEYFAKTFGCCRKVYNLMLADKIKSYEKSQSFGYQTPAMYKIDYPFLKEVDSLALANVQLNLQSALKNCFDKNRKRKNGFPKFKSAKHSKKSYTTNNQNGTVAVLDGYIRLPKLPLVTIGDKKQNAIKACIHRKAPEEWKLKSATVSQDGKGDYYCSLLYEYENQIPEQNINSDKVLGLDFRVRGLYVSSENERCDMPGFYSKSKDRLAKEQKKLSRKKGSRKGEKKSKNYVKQLKKVNRVHVKTANQRKDFLHKQSNEIANHYDLVCIEDISVKDMVAEVSGDLKLPDKAKHAINRTIMDNGWYSFTRMLSYKLEERGKMLVKVDKNFPSTQTCSICGNVKDIPLTKRIYHCEHCHTKIDRDYNAALNLRKEALRIVFG